MNDSQYNKYAIENYMKEVMCMLIGFSVSNFKSFKRTQSISFLASKIVRHKDHVVNKGNKRILKSGLIFGANAGGKSNLIKAIDFSRAIVINGLDKVNSNKCHFRIENDMYKVPGVFEYRLLLEGVEYSYGIAISYITKEIISEWCVKIEASGKEIYLFNRNVDDNGESSADSNYEFDNESDRAKMQFLLEGFGENITEAYKKKSILGDIALRVGDKEGVFAEIRKVYEWINNIIVVFPNSKYKALNEVAADDDVREIFSGLIRYFDTGVESLEGQQREMDFDVVFNDLPREEAEKIKIDISNAVNEYPTMIKIKSQIYILRKDDEGNIIYNKLLLNHGNIDDLFEYADESDGTKRLFDLLPLFLKSMTERTIFVDEIDRSLHTNLTREFFKLFYELVEDKNCQLIATTHDSNLLDLDLVRQDEIWFIERQEDHSSELYSLNRFKERFDKKIDKEYLLGRYGAIPIFNDDIELGEPDDE